MSKLRVVKCSHLDFLPQTVFVKLWSIMIPSVAKLVNLTLQTGVFPDVFKTAHIMPLLKGTSLDPACLKSYRPVSNLTFISKVVETAINNQLQTHFAKHKLLHPNQSAYRTGHSVESTILGVFSSIRQELDRGRTVFLVFA